MRIVSSSYRSYIKVIIKQVLYTNSFPTMDTLLIINIRSIKEFDPFKYSFSISIYLEIVKELVLKINFKH